MITTVSVGDRVRNSFKFNVLKLPMLALAADGTLLESDDFGLYRDDDWSQVHTRTVKSTYIPHTLDQLVGLCEVAVSVFDECEVACHFHHGHYIRLTPSKEYRMSVYGTMDNVFPSLMIRAPYNLRSLEGVLGLYRDTCQNMAMLSSVQTASMRIPHLSTLDNKVDELTDLFADLKASWADIKLFVTQMQNIKVLLAGFLVDVFGPEPVLSDDVTQRKVNNYRQRERLITNRIIDERRRTGRPQYDGIVSLWEAYNGVQGYHQHDASNVRKLSSFERILKANDNPYVKAAEQTARATVQGIYG